MPELPTGTVTFLFTDLEGSTRLWEEHPGRDAARRWHATTRSCATRSTAHGGYVVKTTGDGVHAAFATAADAVDAAIAAQLALAPRSWDRDRAAAGADGRAHGRRRGARRRLLRQRGEPRGTAHGGRARWPDRGVARRRASSFGDDCTVRAGRSRRAPPPRPRAPGAVFQVDASGPAARRSRRCGRSRSFPTNLPLQTHVVRRPRRRPGRGDRAALDAAASSRSPASAASARPGSRSRWRPSCCRASATACGSASSGRWATPTARARGRSPARSACSTRQGTIDGRRASSRRCERSSCWSCSTTASTCSTRRAQLVDAIVAACPASVCSRRAAKASASSGERIMALRSLDLPAEGASVDALSAIDAVRLFVERAAAARRRSRLDRQRDCGRADLPPARRHPARHRARRGTGAHDDPRRDRGRLDERFRLLTGGSRTAVERHQTLRQAVDWSYDLLDAREQTVSRPARRVRRRLHPRRGGGGRGRRRHRASTCSTASRQLVDKSLVVAERRPATAPAIACSRPSASTRSNGSTRRGPPTRSADATRNGSWRSWNEQLTDGGTAEFQWVDRLNLGSRTSAPPSPGRWAIEDLELAVDTVASFDSFLLFSSAFGYAIAPSGQRPC